MGAQELQQQLRSAGFHNTAAGGDGIRVAPASALTEKERQAIRRSRAELSAVIAREVLPSAIDPAAAMTLQAWTDADIENFTTRRDRLIWMRRPPAEAESLADFLTNCDRTDDDRKSCIDCWYYRPRRCGNHVRAGLHAPDLGRDLAELLQRCLGFRPMK